MNKKEMALEFLIEKNLLKDNLIQFIDIMVLNNDRLNYQRDRIEAKVIEHMASFQSLEPDLIVWNFRGLAFQRVDKSYWILNGQHHVEAAMRLGITKLQFYVLQSDSIMYEKFLFNEFQKFQAEFCN